MPVAERSSTCDTGSTKPLICWHGMAPLSNVSEISAVLTCANGA